MNLFEYSTSFPPTEQEFGAIAQRLLDSLNDRMEVAFEPANIYVESGSWVTIKIRSNRIHVHLMDSAYVGIISYSLRDGSPSIQSVLLPFSKGKRLNVGQNSILVANFIENGTGGEWEDFIWAVDGYGEWECDDLPIE